MKHTGIALLAFCLISTRVPAADLGIWGDLWPVQEQDMLTLITQRLEALQKVGEMGPGNGGFQRTRDRAQPETGAG